MISGDDDEAYRAALAANLALLAGLKRYADSVSALLHLLTLRIRVRNEETFADFTLVCGDHRWPVHSTILAAQSEVLGKACKQDYKEGQERTITFTDETPAVIDALVSYLYTLDYGNDSLNKQAYLHELVLHVRVCILGDKFDIQPLKKIATSKFKKLTRHRTDPDQIAPAAAEAYDAELATASICYAIVQYGVEHKLLSTDLDSMLYRVMRERPAFAADYAREIEQNSIIKLEDEQRFKCPGCSRTFVGQVLFHMTCYGCRDTYAGSSWAVVD